MPNTRHRPPPPDPYSRWRSIRRSRSLFDYRPPSGCDPAALVPGLRVEVPFGRRTLIGMLVACAAGSQLPAARLRAVRAVLDTEPVLDATTFGLVRWAAGYYHHPLGEAFAAALPAALRAGRPLIAARDALSAPAGRDRGARGGQASRAAPA